MDNLVGVNVVTILLIRGKGNREGNLTKKQRD